MRRNSVLAALLTAVLAVAGAAVATAKLETYRIGNLIIKADGGVTPKTLPKDDYTSVKFNIRGKIGTADGTHPPAFRELRLDIDRNGAIETKGLPACKRGKIEATTTATAKKACGKSIVGSGNGRIQISFPEQPPIPVKAPITVFNGGTKGSKTTLFIHTYITVPVPSAVVTTVISKRVSKGRYGLSTVSKIPVIAGGSGSVLEFDIDFEKTYSYKGKKQSYFLAKCPDGHLNARIVEAVFVNEAGGPREKTTLSDETIVRACTPKG